MDLELDIGSVVGQQLSCNGCPLRSHWPVPLYVPLHAHLPVSLLILPRPYSDSVSPAADPRRLSLIARVPVIGTFAVTYLTSCWSDPSEDIPTRSVDACFRHRSGELAVLHPPLIVTVGEQACLRYLGASLSDVGEGVWQRESGERVVALPDASTVSDEQASHIVSLHLGEAEAGVYDLQ